MVTQHTYLNFYKIALCGIGKDDAGLKLQYIKVHSAISVPRHNV